MPDGPLLWVAAVQGHDEAIVKLKWGEKRSNEFRPMRLLASAVIAAVNVPNQQSERNLNANFIPNGKSRCMWLRVAAFADSNFCADSRRRILYYRQVPNVGAEKLLGDCGGVLCGASDGCRCICDVAVNGKKSMPLEKSSSCESFHVRHRQRHPL
jgi:hypothetical protein